MPRIPSTKYTYFKCVNKDCYVTQFREDEYPHDHWGICPECFKEGVKKK